MKVTLDLDEELFSRLTSLVGRKLESRETGEQLHFSSLEECCVELLDDVVDVYLDEYRERM